MRVQSCDFIYVHDFHLRQEPLGQGAFATVQKCRLRRPAAPAAPAAAADTPSAGRRPSLSLSPSLASFRSPSFRRSSLGGRPPRERDACEEGGKLVAVKQLKPAVLGNETELHGFIAETDGTRCSHSHTHMAMCSYVLMMG